MKARKFFKLVPVVILLVTLNRTVTAPTPLYAHRTTPGRWQQEAICEATSGDCYYVSTTGDDSDYFAIKTSDEVLNESGLGNVGSGGTASVQEYSDSYPLYEDAPALTSYVSDGAFNNTYYIATTGNDTTGTGAIGSPWASVNGARTGGAGTAAAAGDLVYFRGGTYVATIEATGSGSGKIGGYYFDKNGTATDYIVFSAYPSENPIFTTSGDQRPSINIRGDYTVVDSLQFTTGSLTVVGAGDCIVQNAVFNGNPYDPWGDQYQDTHLGMSEGVTDITIRNSYFNSGDAHAIKEYQSDGVVAGITITYNRIYNNSVNYGAINFKGGASGLVVSYNRFEQIDEAFSWGTNYFVANGWAYHQVESIHHNVFDDVELILRHQGAPARDIRDLSFYSNIVLNGVNTVLLRYYCEDGCWDSPAYDMGDFYDNAFYGINDLINPGTTSDFSGNYPVYFNYNAHPSTTIRDTAENQNSLASSFWQGSALIQASHGITRTGDAGNRFYTISNDSGFIGAGRYGGNIGGFVFDSDQTPPARQNPSPTGTLQAGTTATTLSLTTNEQATCKYSETPNTAYADMTDTFQNTDSTTIRDTAENQNSLASSFWQGSALGSSKI